MKSSLSLKCSVYTCNSYRNAPSALQFQPHPLKSFVHPCFLQIIKCRLVVRVSCLTTLPKGKQDQIQDRTGSKLCSVLSAISKCLSYRYYSTYHPTTWAVRGPDLGPGEKAIAPKLSSILRTSRAYIESIGSSHSSWTSGSSIVAVCSSRNQMSWLK